MRLETDGRLNNFVIVILPPGETAVQKYKFKYNVPSSACNPGASENAVKQNTSCGWDIEKDAGNILLVMINRSGTDLPTTTIN